MRTFVMNLVRVPLNLYLWVDHLMGEPFYPEVKERYCQNQAPYRTPHL